MRLIKNLFPAVCILLVLFSSCKNEEQPAYKNTQLSFDERVEDLVSRMTLEEKVAQMLYEAPAIERLGVPAHNWWNECLHGVARAGKATVFPQAIGMAAMWDTEQMFEIANAISDEARAKHHDYASRGKYGIYQGLTYWTPNINIFRDPRWGRGMETYGEDPYLTGELAVQFVKGLQGDDPKYLKLVATAKHFTVHSGPESTRHSFDVNPSDRDFLETYTPHFKKVVEEARVYSVMCAYQRFRGMPCCGSAFLDNLLRNEWGFDGYIVSDCEAIVNFYQKGRHEVVETKEEAAAMAVQAGTDLNCGGTYKALVKAVQDGLISEEEIDVAVKRLMKARMLLGQFDPANDVKYSKISLSVVESEKHRSMALLSAEKSMVLLKNEGNTLPLSKDLKNIAVIGPNAHDLEVLLANYNGYPTNPVTPLDGIRNKMKHAKVNYAIGCPVAENMPILEAIPASAFYTDASLSTQGLNAKYYENNALEGNAKHTVIDKNIDFTWGTNSPFEDIKYDMFSASWEGVILPPVTGSYAIGGEAFSGFNLYINDSLLISRFNTHHPRKEYEHINMTAGQPCKIKVEYKQNNTEHAMARILWEVPGANLKKEALEIAQEADAIIFCMGISPLLEGEDMKVKVPGFMGGDRLDIQLPAVQTNLMKEIMKLGKPAVLVLLNGSALAINWEDENIPAIIEAWYPGQEGGTALANIIFGDYNPSGRLPLTFYKSIDQIPAFDDYDMQGRTYRYFKGNPLYEFGYGLSYTTFEYSLGNVPELIHPEKSIKLSVEVSNTGKMDGDEIVQLYVSHPQSAQLKRPIRSLAGFKRVHLKAGEKKTVEFELNPSQLAVLDDNNQWKTEPGNILFSIGGKQPDVDAVNKKNVVEITIPVTQN